jgi:hypothetical protein
VVVALNLHAKMDNALLPIGDRSMVITCAILQQSYRLLSSLISALENYYLFVLNCCRRKVADMQEIRRIFYSAGVQVSGITDHICVAPMILPFRDQSTMRLFIGTHVSLYFRKKKRKKTR